MAAFALAAASLALTAAGAAKQYSASKKTAAANQAIADQEAQQEAIRKRAAELDARRRQLEIVRNQQRARSLALATATSQGASGGSGLQGGYGQIAGDTGVNLLGVTQNLGLASQLFDSNAQISGYRRQIAGYQSQAALGQGLSSLGGALLNSIGPLTAMSKGFGGGVNTGGTTPSRGPVAFSNSAFGRGGIY